MNIPDEAVKAVLSVFDGAVLYKDMSIDPEFREAIATGCIRAALPHLPLPTLEGAQDRGWRDLYEARIKELEDGLRDALPFLGRERKEAAHPSEIARLHALLSPSDDRHQKEK